MADIDVASGLSDGTLVPIPAALSNHTLPDLKSDHHCEKLEKFISDSGFVQPNLISKAVDYLNRTDVISARFSLLDLEDMRLLLLGGTSLDPEFTKRFVRAVFDAELYGSKDEINLHARNLIEKSTDNNFHDLKLVARLWVNHATEIDRHDLQKLLIHAEQHVADAPLELLTRRPHPELYKKGCLLSVDSTGGQGTHALEVMLMINSRFFGDTALDQPAKYNQPAKVRTYEMPLHQISRLNAEDWKNAVFEQREFKKAQHTYPVQRELRVCELLFRMYGLDGCQINIDPPAKGFGIAKWQISYYPAEV